MHAPTIPAHHEGNGFDLLFLVQILKSFLFYTRLVSSNRLVEEKAGHLYAVCLCLVRKPAATQGLQHQRGRGAESAVTVMFLHIRRVLNVCPSACSHHSQIIRSLLGELAEKNLRLNEKLTHMGQRTTRAKLLSYFSGEVQRRGGYEFDIPFSRQQLADYLGVERSGLSMELGKMRDEGLLDFHKSHFLLKTPEADRPFPSAR